MLPQAHCCYPGCIEFGGHQHHVTYDPECKKPLCDKHHREITHLNGIQSRKYNYAKLTNKFRWWIWYQWLEGKLKPRRTRKAQEWTNEWDLKATVVPLSVEPTQRPEPPTVLIKPKQPPREHAAMKKGKLFAVIGHKRWGKSTTLLFLTDHKKVRYFTIKGQRFCIKRMSNDDIPKPFFQWIKDIEPETCPAVIIALCPTFDTKRSGRLVAALNSLRKRYDLFFFVLFHRYRPSTDHIEKEEIDRLKKFGTVQSFKSRTQGETRARALKKFIVTNL